MNLKLKSRKKKPDYDGISLSKRSLRIFVKNKLALTSGIFILFIGLISVLGYLIAPDDSPYSNSQMLEIASRKPGFSVNCVLIKENKSMVEPSVFHKMLYGREPEYQYIPYSSYRFDPPWMIIETYQDETEHDSINVMYHLADVAFALMEGAPIECDSISGAMTFKTIDGEEITRSVEEIQRIIENGHIKKRYFFLGTDRFGRDMLSQLIIGARVSFSVGFVAVCISLMAGLFFGSLAGFFRGWVDDLILWFINVIWALPTLLLSMAITFALGKGFWQVFVAIGLTMWVEVARVARGQIISIREKEYIEATKALGLPFKNVIFRHVLPNIMGAVIVISAANFASAILLEAGLSFLGIGVQPPMPSWGSMIKDHYGYIILDQAYLAVLPGLAIMLLVLAFMIFGNGLRDAMDSRSVK